MKTNYYKIGGHSLAVNFVDEANDEKLIPSFAPFRLEERPEDLQIGRASCRERV